jgi:hypothetical protein
VTSILQRLLFSSDSHSPAPPILQRLPFSSAYHPTFLWSLLLSKPYISPAPTFLWPLLFSGPYFSRATTFLRPLQEGKGLEKERGRRNKGAGETKGLEKQRGPEKERGRRRRGARETKGLEKQRGMSNEAYLPPTFAIAWMSIRISGASRMSMAMGRLQHGVGPSTTPRRCTSIEALTSKSLPTSPRARRRPPRPLQYRRRSRHSRQLATLRYVTF